MSFRIDDKKLLEKYKTNWTKFENLKNIELNALPFFYDRYIKSKIQAHGYKVYNNFRGLNLLEDEIECESFTVICFDSLVFMKTNITCKYIYTTVLIKL